MLYGYANDVLGKFMKLAGAKTPYGRKAIMVDFLANQLLNKTAESWHMLDTLAQKAVAAAYYAGGNFDTVAFKAQYDKLPRRKPSRYGFYSTDPIWFELFVHKGEIPTDLMPRLAELVPPPDRFQLVGEETLPTPPPDMADSIVAETEQMGLNDLLTYLRLVDQGSVKFSATTGQATGASIRKVADNLIAGDYFPLPEKLHAKDTIRPFGLDVFARESGLTTRTGKLTKAGRTFLQTRDLEVLLDAVEKWAENGRFDELSRITAVKGQRSKRTKLTPPKERRSRVFEALSWCPTNVWINIEEFYRAIKVWQFNFDVEKTDFTQLSLGGSSHYDSWSSDDDYWRITSGLYTNAIIWEYLATIGAVDIAYVHHEEADFQIDGGWHWDEFSYSPYDGLRHFRINKLGAFLFGQADDYAPIEPHASKLFTISSALELTILDKTAVSPNLRILLETIAEPQDETRYRLDTQRFLTALEDGQSWKALADFVREYHDGALETAVSDWLKRLKRNSSSIKRGQDAIFITLAHPDLSNMLRDDNIVGKFIHLLNSKTAVIPASRERTFRKRLKELEYLLAP